VSYGQKRTRRKNPKEGGGGELDKEDREKNNFSWKRVKDAWQLGEKINLERGFPQHPMAGRKKKGLWHDIRKKKIKTTCGVSGGKASPLPAKNYGRKGGGVPLPDPSGFL